MTLPLCDVSSAATRLQPTFGPGSSAYLPAQRWWRMMTTQMRRRAVNCFIITTGDYYLKCIKLALGCRFFKAFYVKNGAINFLCVPIKLVLSHWTWTATNSFSWIKLLLQLNVPNRFASHQTSAVPAVAQCCQMLLKKICQTSSEIMPDFLKFCQFDFLVKLSSL